MTGLTIDGELVDLNGAKLIEVEVSADGKLWVNVDGICRLRAQDTQVLIVSDKRPQKRHVDT